MTGPRINPSNIGLPAVRPVASPRDRFVVPKRSGLVELAEGLGQVSRRVGDLSDLLQERLNQREFAAGVRSAEELRGVAKTFAQAVKDGRLEANQNPFFVKGLSEQLGRIAADEFSSQFQLIKERRLADTTEPADLDALFVEERKTFLESLGNDANADFLNGFNPRLDAHLANVRQQFNREASERLQEDIQDALFSEIRGAIAGGIAAEVSPESIGQAIDLAIKRQIDVVGSIDGRLASNIATQAIALYAEEQLDTSILDLADHVPGGAPGSKLSGRRETQKLLNAARNRIINELESQKRFFWAEEDRRKSQVIESVYTDYTKALVEAGRNPNAVNLRPFQDRLIEAGVGSAADNLFQFRRAYSEASIPDNPTLVNTVIPQIYTVTDPSDPSYVSNQRLVGLMTGRNLSRSDFEALQRHLEHRDSVGRRKDPAETEKNRLFRDALTRIRRAFVPDFDDGASQARQDAANFAQQELSARWLTFITSDAGQKASQLETLSFIKEMSTDIVESARQTNPDLLEGSANELRLPNQRVDRTTAWRSFQLVTNEQLSLMEAQLRIVEDPSQLPTDIVRFLLTLGVETPEEALTFIQEQRRIINRNVRQ